MAHERKGCLPGIRNRYPQNLPMRPGSQGDNGPLPIILPVMARSGLDRHAAGMVRQPASDSVYWHAPPGSSVVQAGASPASPEPSLTRHICCPGKNRKLQSPSPPRYLIARYDRLPIVATVPSQRIRKTAFAAPLGEAAHREDVCSDPECTFPSPRSASRTPFAAVPSPRSSISYRRTVLRN
jgi:hypothetical protein